MSDTLCNEKKKPYTFSEDGNSCIITETRTPRYWYNYLWNENHYCAQISQTGHGHICKGQKLSSRDNIL